MGYRRRPNRRRRTKLGVPKGFTHNWAYKGRWHERKVHPGLWKIDFRATKHRKARSWGNFGKGTTGAWKIQGIQYIKKTGMGSYQTRLIGTKKPLKFNIRR